VSLFHAKTVQQRPLLPREVETRLPDCGVSIKKTMTDNLCSTITKTQTGKILKTKITPIHVIRAILAYLFFL